MFSGIGCEMQLQLKYLFTATILSFLPSLQGTSAEKFDFVIGTSFPFSSQGHYLTAAHVLNACDNITVRTNEQNHTIEILYVDELTDVAIFKIDSDSSDFFDLSYDTSQIGDSVRVVGYPFGTFDKTVTGGVISRLYANDEAPGWMQFDAVVQPGNSGGPILNENKEVVGMALAKYQTSFLSLLIGQVHESESYGIRTDIILEAFPSDIVEQLLQDKINFSSKRTETLAAVHPIICEDLEILVNDSEALFEDIKSQYQLSLQKSAQAWNSLLETLKINDQGN